MSKWQGHGPTTRVVLTALLEKVTAAGDPGSWDERVLFTVCEFWAAYRNGELEAYLVDDGTETLSDAAIALERIGAADAAGVVRDVLGAGPRRPAIDTAAAAGVLNAALPPIVSGVDARIEGFAQHLAPAAMLGLSKRSMQRAF